MVKLQATNTTQIHDVHLVLAPKGGVGKSFIASLLAQFSIDRGQKMRVLDLDQSNATVAGFKALGGQPIDLLSDGGFDTDKMDAVMDILVGEPGPFIMDVGASVFQDTWRYFTKYDISRGLEEQNRRLVYHVVLCGGTETVHGLSGFDAIAEASHGRQMVVWVNPFRGPVELDGTDFLSMSVYRKHESKVLAVVILPVTDRATMNDLSAIGKLNLVLDEAKGEPSIFFPSKQRLRVYRNEVFKQIGTAWPLVMGESVSEPERANVAG
jgi:hypothetical protein